MQLDSCAVLEVAGNWMKDNIKTDLKTGKGSNFDKTVQKYTKSLDNFQKGYRSYFSDKVCDITKDSCEFQFLNPGAPSFIKKVLSKTYFSDSDSAAIIRSITGDFRMMEDADKSKPTLSIVKGKDHINIEKLINDWVDDCSSDTVTLNMLSINTY